MSEPSTSANDEPTRPTGEPGAVHPDQDRPEPAATTVAQEQPTQVFPATGPTQAWYGQPGAGYGQPPYAGPPGYSQPGYGGQPSMTPDPRRQVPLLGRVPGALVAAAAVGLLVVGVAGGFGLARATDSSPTTTAASTTQLGSGTAPGGTGTAPGGTGTQGGTGTGGQRGGSTIGTISAVDGASFTVQTPAGQDVTIVTDASTQVEAAGGTTVDVLAVGDVVMVRGTRATDGSVTATLVVQGRLSGGSGAPGTTQGGTGGTTAAPSPTTGGTTT